VRVAAVGQPAQHLQEIAVIGCDPPRLHEGLAAGVTADMRWRKSLMFVTALPFRPTMMSPKRMAGLGCRTAGYRIEEERAVGCRKTQREGQRQLERFHLDAQPALLRVVGLAAQLDLQLQEAPLRLRGLARAGRDRRGLLDRRDGVGADPQSGVAAACARY